CLPLEPLTDDNPTSSQSWNRHSTLEVDRIALSAVLTSLSFRKAPVDKVPVLRVQHQLEVTRSSVDTSEGSAGARYSHCQKNGDPTARSLHCYDEETGSQRELAVTLRRWLMSCP
nr:hypothetical protein [Tanacetum cinerariifolium]